MVELAVLNTKAEIECVRLAEILSLLQVVSDNTNGAGNSANAGEIIRNAVNSLNLGIDALDKCIDRLEELNQEYIHTDYELRKVMGVSVNE